MNSFIIPNATQHLTPILQHRWIKISLRALAIIVGLIVVLWLGLAAYVNMHKKALLTSITKQLNEGINGTVTIESMEPALLRGFPGISISLKNVVLRDTLWHVHKHDLLQAKDIYVAVNAFSILSGTPTIKDVSINSGNIYLFTDSNGYSNTSLFHKSEDTTKKKKNSPKINEVYLNDVHFVFENNSKNKLFRFDIDKLESRVLYSATGWKTTLKIKTLVKDMNFNTAKGSFLKNKTLVTNLAIEYDEAKKILNIPLQKIAIDRDDIQLGGHFLLSASPVTFSLDIRASDITLANARSLLSPSIAAKRQIVDFKKPLDLSATIAGSMKFRDTPLVQVAWVVKNNTLVTPGGDITDCNFNGVFTNQASTAAGHNDPNSRISLYHLQGKWTDIPFKADTIQIANLKHPVLSGRFNAGFPLVKLNDVLGGEDFTFNDGSVSLNLLYKGGLSSEDTIQPYVKGNVIVQKASLTYLPRGLTMTNGSAILNFTGSDLYLENVHAQNGSTSLQMNGSILNFLNLYYTAPDKILIDWHIKSPLINLNDYLSFLGRRKKKAVATAKKTTSGNKVSKISDKLDEMLSQGSVHMQMQLDKVIYKHFVASRVNADITLAESGIKLQNINVEHAGGRLSIKGNIDQSSSVNRLGVQAQVTTVNVRDFLQSFDNFGQDAITDKNIRGLLSVDADISGSITDNGTIVPNSLAGTLSFTLANGALVQFPPLLKIGKFAFRNRNLGEVTFREVKDKFELKDNKIVINPLYIESSALNINVEGVYGLKSGTDINIDIPLRNPKKDELILDDDERQERNMKGLVLHLKAADNNDGDVKIKWNKKKDRKKEQEKDDK